MRRVSLIILIATFNLLFLQSIKAELRLPAIVSSNMVLQRNTTVELWRWADGYKTVGCAAPIFDSQEIKDGGIVLKFKNAKTGLYSYDELNGFEIAGEDKVFYPANAKIVDDREVYVISDQVPNPVAVRYAWRNWVVGTLYDANLLPASSFRTDDWDNATKVEK